MNIPRLLSSLVILACYFPVVVIALGIAPTRRFRSASVLCRQGMTAVVDDCRALVDGLRNTTRLNYGRECAFGPFYLSRAYNPICRHDGECCIYTNRRNTPPEVLKEFGEVILNNCADDLSNNINGATQDMDGNTVCLANGHACQACWSGLNVY